MRGQRERDEHENESRTAIYYEGKMFFNPCAREHSEGNYTAYAIV